MKAVIVPCDFARDRKSSNDRSSLDWMTCTAYHTIASLQVPAPEPHHTPMPPFVVKTYLEELWPNIVRLAYIELTIGTMETDMFFLAGSTLTGARSSGIFAPKLMSRLLFMVIVSVVENRAYELRRWTALVRSSRSISPLEMWYSGSICAESLSCVFTSPTFIDQFPGLLRCTICSWCLCNNVELSESVSGQKNVDSCGVVKCFSTGHYYGQIGVLGQSRYQKHVFPRLDLQLGEVCRPSR